VEGKRMVTIGGCLVVLIAVLVGFTMSGGHVGALLHPSELVTIGGASLGALIIMSPKKVLLDLVRCIVQVIKGTPYNRATYVELFDLLYNAAKITRRDGLLALESQLGEPQESPLFQKYPKLLKNPHVLHFLNNALALLPDGKTPEQVKAALEEELQVVEREHHAAVAVLLKTADALPGFGIVAAVLGIVVTMQAIDGPANEIGHKVGAALVGTFLGILMSYGFFAPMAGRMEFLGEAELIFFRAISTAVVAIGAGENPREVITRAARMVGSDCRPTQAEMTQIFKQG
jgi:chemotaxis protein MotA